MKKIVSVILTGLLLSSCATAPQQQDPFDLALASATLQVLTQPIKPMKGDLE